MESVKFFQLLSDFSQQELKNWHKFMHSPFFQQNAKVVLLSDFLLDQLRKQQPLLKETAFQLVYPNQIYDDQKMRLLISYAFRATEQYLAITNWMGSKDKVAVHLVDAYKERVDTHKFEKLLHKINKKREQQPIQNADYLWNSFEIQKEQYDFLSKKQPTGDVQLQPMSDQLDQAYAAHRLKTACLQITHEQVYKTKYDLGLLVPVLELVQTKKWLTIPAIGVYYYCYLMLTKPQKIAHFQLFKKELLAKDQFFPTAEIRDLYLLAINYCVKKINEGLVDFYREALDLYQQGLAKKWLLENNVLFRFTYHNIVKAGLKTANFEWTAQFILDYKNNLARSYRASSYAYNQALLAYHQGQKEVAMQLLQRGNRKDVLLSISAKILLVKIYYEEALWELLIAHLKAMENYIRRKSMIGYHKLNSLNVIRYTHKLLDLGALNKGERAKLAAEIAEETNLPEKEWFLVQTLERL